MKTTRSNTPRRYVKGIVAAASGCGSIIVAISILRLEAHVARGVRVAVGILGRLMLPIADSREVKGDGITIANKGTSNPVLLYDGKPMLRVGCVSETGLFAFPWDSSEPVLRDMTHVAQSRDRGNTWKTISGPECGLPDSVLNNLLLDPNDPRRIYAGSGGNGLFVGKITAP